MPAILLFQKDNKALPLADLSDTMAASLGVFCFAWVQNKKVPAEELKGDARNLTQGQFWVEIPELQEDEGLPLVTVEVTPRLDRAEDMQGLIDEILSQDSSLKKVIDKNSRDILITAEDTAAGTEAANAIAYAVAEMTGSGLLLPGLADDDETLWFDSSDDFAEAVFDVSDDDEDDDDNDDLGDDEDDEEEEDEDEDEKPKKK